MSTEAAKAPPGDVEGPPGQKGRGHTRTAILVVALSVAGSVLGLGRDLAIAKFFGASHTTDAFFIAWMIPETITPLLMEGALSYALIPLFSRELANGRDLSAAIRGTLGPLTVVFAATAAAVALGAPLWVELVAPGIGDPALAARCVRVASVTIVFLGLSGFLMAALRAHRSFGWPAAVYVAYNVAILASIIVLHDRLQIVSAAVGLAVGSAAMVAIQLPAFIRKVGAPVFRLRADRELLRRLAVFGPIAVYTLSRQGQVYVERFLGSLLPAGAISHLNYAAKIAQVPMLLALTFAAVTLPAMAQSAARGARDELRALVQRNFQIAGALVLPATGFLVAFAPQIIGLLFQRGAFHASDTASTAGVLRVYSLGLLSQVFVGVGVEAMVARGERTWFPARAAGIGLAATVVVGVATYQAAGAAGLAIADAVGISAMALAVLTGVRRQVAPIDLVVLRGFLARCLLAAAAAAALGLVVGRLLEPSASSDGGRTVALVAGGLTLMGSYALIGRLLRIDGFAETMAGAGAKLRSLRARGPVNS